jgi:hypothetical protein
MLFCRSSRRRLLPVARCVATVICCTHTQALEENAVEYVVLDNWAALPPAPWVIELLLLRELTVRAHAVCRLAHAACAFAWPAGRPARVAQPRPVAPLVPFSPLSVPLLPLSVPLSPLSVPLSPLSVALLPLSVADRPTCILVSKATIATIKTGSIATRNWWRPR